MTQAEDKDVGRKRRRDYEQNRDVILQAADAAFAELGMGVSINVIADQAGVAPATVYRHFPSRKALDDAVFEVRITAYAEAIEAAQEVTDPDAAFRQTIHSIVALQARDRSFREILNSREAHPLSDPAVERFATALLGALERARVSKVLRDDVADADILLFLIASEGIARPVAQRSETALNRLVSLALDSVCGTRTEMAGEPLRFDQLIDVTGS